MRDSNHTPLAGNKVPNTPRRSRGIVAGLAVLLWALISATWAEI